VTVTSALAQLKPGDRDVLLFAGAEHSYQDIADALRVPDALRAAVESAARKTDNPLGYEMLTIVGDLLGESVAPSQLRASLYRITADIPGLELVGTVTERADRRGTAVAARRGDTQLELVFDPRTSVLLAQQETLLHQIADTSAPVGTVISYTLYLNSSITKSLSTP
jgi:hypothetical protein